MKKVFLSASILMSTLAFAQSFGVKAGINVSSISEKGYKETNTRVGFNAGVFANIPLSSTFSVQPELLYSQQGSKTKDVIAGKEFSDVLKLDYISVPVMFQYKVIPQFYVEAGPEFSFLASSKNETKLGGSTGELDLDSKFFNKFNFGLGIGAGFDITQNIGVNARYVFGLTDVTKDDPTYPVANREKHNMGTFQAGLYYKF